MEIPSNFTIFGQNVTVKVVECLDNKYGDFNDAKSLIRIAKTLQVDNETIKLTQEQILSTFFHEVFHAFQWYIKGEFCEIEAQSYANALIELGKSGNLWK